MVIKSGYELNRRDEKMYKDSWLRSYLSNGNESNGANMVRQLDSVFSNEPMSLKDICRVQIRKCLEKPLKKSISQLDIPIVLKKFLAFEIISY